MDHGQLAKEIKENSWLIGKAGKETLLNQHFRDLWHTSLNEMGANTPFGPAIPNTPPSTEIQLLDNQHIRIATAKRMRPLFQYRTLFVPARRKESAGRKVFHSDIGKQLMNSQITETVFFQQSQGVTPYPPPATGFIHIIPPRPGCAKDQKNIDPQSPPPAGSRFLSSAQLAVGKQIILGLLYVLLQLKTRIRACGIAHLPHIRSVLKAEHDFQVFRLRCTEPYPVP